MCRERRLRRFETAFPHMKGSIMSHSDALFVAGRRAFIGMSGMLLSGAAVTLLAGRDAFAATRGDKKNAVENDVRILNTALGAEYQAVAAYQLDLDSRLLEKRCKARRSFRVITRNTPMCSRRRLANSEANGSLRCRPHSFPAEETQTAGGRVATCCGARHGAVSAYLGAVPVFDNRDAKAAASILADEAMHWAVLRHAVGDDPVPGAFESCPITVDQQPS